MKLRPQNPYVESRFVRVKRMDLSHNVSWFTINWLCTVKARGHDRLNPMNDIDQARESTEAYDAPLVVCEIMSYDGMIETDVVD